MIQIQVQGEYYNLPQKWADITVARWIAFSKEVAPTEPECMYNGELNRENYTREALPYMAKYLEFWAEMPEGLAMKCNHETVAILYRALTHSLAALPVPDESPVFQHQGELWYLPKKAFEGSSVQDFIEAAQYQDMAEKLGLGQWGVLPKLLCILVRKEGEQYSDVLMEREEMFLSWPMSIAWQVSFFLHRLGQTYLQSFQSSEIALNLSSLKQVLENLQSGSGGTVS